MTEKMELTFDVQKIAIFVLVIIFNSLPRVAGLILGNTTVKSCNASSQNIDFVVDLQNGTIPSGSEIWYYESTVIATRPGGIFTPQGNYTSRLHTYSTYGLTLDNITAADKGTYLFVFLYYTPTPQGSKTATSTLTVNVAPDDSCIPSYKKSGDLAICELDPAANCGSPRLEPMWTHTYGNTFTVTNAGTYTCCANGSILMDCYRGSSSFCKTFQVGGQQSLLWLLLLILLIILLIFLIFFCCGCLDCCKFCRNFDHYEVSKSCYVTWYFIKRGCCSFFFCKSGSKRGKCFCGDHKGERCGGCLYCRKKCTYGWSCNCKGINTSCCGCCFCICCVPARRKEEDPLTVCIDSKDAIFKPVAGKVTISCTVEGYGHGSTQVKWTGPNENELKDKTKYEITLYSEETGKSSLTILAFSSSDSGWYTCQAMDGEEYVVVDCINITAHDNERNTNRTGSSAAVSREHVELQMERKGVMGGDEERAPGIHIGTEKKVNSETSSKKTKDRPQPLPPVAILTEDIPKFRPQPPPPDNIYVNDRNQRGISANFDDSQGLPSDIPRSSRLPPLTQSTLEKEDASEKPKKKKNKKKKKAKVNEGTSEEGMDESKSKRTLSEDQFAED